MLCLKKYYTDDLLRLALLLSLLRVDPESYFGYDVPAINVGGLDRNDSTGWQEDSPLAYFRPQFVHPKNLDNVLLNYERQVFEDLNSLGRYSRTNSIVHNLNVTAYLLNIDRDREGLSISDALNDGETASALAEPVEAGGHAPPTEDSGVTEERNDLERLSDDFAEVISSAELTQEDMELIKHLIEQDIDIGCSFTNDIEAEPSSIPSVVEDLTFSLINASISGTSSSGLKVSNSDDEEKLKALQAINDKFKKENASDSNEDLLPNSCWSSHSYTDIDSETGEHVQKTEPSIPSFENCSDIFDLSSELSNPLDELFLSEELPFDLHDTNIQDTENQEDEEKGAKTSCQTASSPETQNNDLSSAALEDSASSDLTYEDELLKMIQTAPFHYPHSRAFQSHMPSILMDPNFQDWANLLGSAETGSTANPHHAFSTHHPATLHVSYGHTPAAHMSQAVHSTMGHVPPDTRGVLLHNATLAPPMGELNSTVPYHSTLSGTNLGSAVATSMNLTNSSEPINDSGSTTYKIENSHDMMYYPNSSEVGNNTDGFLTFLDDGYEHLMDMVGISEGILNMRPLDSSCLPGSNGSNSAPGNISELNCAMGTASSAMRNSNLTSTNLSERVDATSSDSAVSSMGSERVPSLSDSDWCDGASDSGQTGPADSYTSLHYTSGYSSKYRPHDYSYMPRTQPDILSDRYIGRLSQVVQKKHQMFGKRYFQDQGNNSLAQPSTVKYEYPETSVLRSFGNPTNQSIRGSTISKYSEMKYSCTPEFNRLSHSSSSPGSNVHHNHTYSLPAENTGAMQKAILRDKVKMRKNEDEPHLTRDEKRARALSVPLSVDDIINLPMDEFNERLSKYDLSEPQLSLIRDIRRRGKNKVAAQNCRKRKLDQIHSLADEVQSMRDKKLCLLKEREFIMEERQRVKDKFTQLYRHLFQHLRDPDGNLYPPSLYSLQQSADGSVLIVPRSNNTLPPRTNDKDGNRNKDQQQS